MTNYERAQTMYDEIRTDSPVDAVARLVAYATAERQEEWNRCCKLLGACPSCSAYAATWLTGCMNPIHQKKACVHVWGIDGIHSNEFCKKCFVTKEVV